MADRIHVLSDGSIIENVSHKEFVRLGGTYVRMFEIQAESYH